MKLHKAIPLVLTWNKQGFRHMPERQHVHITGNPVRLSVVTVEGLLEIQTDYPGVGDFWVVPAGLKGFKGKDLLRVVDGQLCRVNGLEIPLAPFSMIDDLPTIDMSGFSPMGEIQDFHRMWNLACDHMSNDPSRYTLGGVAICDNKGKLAIAAVNGHTGFLTDPAADYSKAVCVPRDTALLIGKVDGDLTISTRHEIVDKVAMAKWVRLETSDTVLVSRMLEGEFFNISNAVPKSEAALQITVTAAAWKAAWTAVKSHPDSLVTESHRGILDIQDGKVTVRPPQRGDQPTSITIPAYVKAEVRRTALLNCEYALICIPGDEIFVAFHNLAKPSELVDGPIRITGDLGTCLLMPIGPEKSMDKDIKARIAALAVVADEKVEA